MSINSLTNEELSKNNTIPQTVIQDNSVTNVLNALVKYIPTEVITLYIAAVSATSALQTVFSINAIILYWSFIVLTPIVLLLVYLGKRAVAQEPLQSFKELPWWKMFASASAFGVWALAIPNNPYVEGGAGAVIAGLGAMFISLILNPLSQKFDGPVQPVFPKAKQFSDLFSLIISESDEDRRNTYAGERKEIVEGVQIQFQENGRQLTKKEINKCLLSQFELDKVGLYLFEEFSDEDPDLDKRLRRVESEFRKVRASGYKEKSLYPLHYSIRSYLTRVKSARNSVQDKNEHIEKFEKILKEFNDRPDLDTTNDIKDKLNSVIAVLKSSNT